MSSTHTRRDTCKPHPGLPELTARHVQSERLLTVKEAASLLGLGRTTLYQLMDRGELAYYRFGSARRIDPADLERLKESCRCGGASAGTT